MRPAHYDGQQHMKWAINIFYHKMNRVLGMVLPFLCTNTAPWIQPFSLKSLQAPDYSEGVTLLKEMWHPMIGVNVLLSPQSLNIWGLSGHYNNSTKLLKWNLKKLTDVTFWTSPIYVQCFALSGHYREGDEAL